MWAAELDSDARKLSNLGCVCVRLIGKVNLAGLLPSGDRHACLLAIHEAVLFDLLTALSGCSVKVPPSCFGNFATVCMTSVHLLFAEPEL